jgi:Arc/MetJ-type ribon-helix-helix transcriptional regulator
MVVGMAKTQKVTVTLPTSDVAAIRALVDANKADTVSGFVQHAVKLSLEEAAGTEAWITQWLEETGGPLTIEEIAWADRILSGEATDVDRGVTGARAHA